jgi:hypothetical protein
MVSLQELAPGAAFVSLVAILQEAEKQFRKYYRLTKAQAASTSLMRI